MFAAFIVGHIVLMWRTLEARWFPRRAAARAAAGTASAWRPGMMAVPVAIQPQRGRMLTRFAGIALIAMSLGYFAVQAKDALERTSDAKSFAVLLAQNICRVAPDANAKSPVQIVATKATK